MIFNNLNILNFRYLFDIFPNKITPFLTSNSGEEVEVGDYFSDLIVSECVIVELKAAEAQHIENEYQLINYLKATEIEVGLLLNFGKTPEFKRKVFSNKR